MSTESFLRIIPQNPTLRLFFEVVKHWTQMFSKFSVRLKNFRKKKHEASPSFDLLVICHFAIWAETCTRFWIEFLQIVVILQYQPGLTKPVDRSWPGSQISFHNELRFLPILGQFRWQNLVFFAIDISQRLILSLECVSLPGLLLNI